MKKAPATARRPKIEQQVCASTTSTFAFTARRWWQTLRDDSEDGLTASLLTVYLARIARFLRRWLKWLEIRRLFRTKRARKKNVVASRRKPISRYAGICIQYWLRRWKRNKAWMVRIYRDRSWAIILERTRSWQRFKFTLPWFRHWRSHTLGFSKVRNALQSKRRIIAAYYNHSRSRSALRFWHVLSLVRRGGKRRAFRALKLLTRLPPLLRAWTRLLLREGLHRWRRRSRWPAVVIFSRRRALLAAVRPWASLAASRAHRRRVWGAASTTHFLRVGTWWRSLVIGCWKRGRLAYSGAGWGQYRRKFLLTGLRRWRCSSGAAAAQRGDLDLGARRHRLHRIGLALSLLSRAARRVRDLGSILEASRPLWSSHAFSRPHPSASQALVAVLLSDASTHRRLLALAAWHRLMVLRRRHWLVWRRGLVAARRERAVAAIYSLSQRERRQLFSRWLCFAHARLSLLSLSERAALLHLRTAFRSLGRSISEIRRRLVLMLQAREHFTTRAVPRALRAWLRHRPEKRARARMSAFFKLRRAVRAWAARALGTSHQAILARRALLRFSSTSPRRLLCRWRGHTARLLVLRRLYRVYQRLHPRPKAGLRAKVFRVWRQAVPELKKQRRAFCAVAQADRRRIKFLALEHWGGLLIDRREMKRRARERGYLLWRQRYSDRLAAFSVFQRFVQFKGFKRAVTAWSLEAASGLPVLPCRAPSLPASSWLQQRHSGFAVKSQALRFAVSVVAFKAESFSAFVRCTVARRILLRWRAVASNARVLDRWLNARLRLCSRRCASLAAAAPRAVEANKGRMKRLVMRAWGGVHEGWACKRRPILLARKKRILAAWLAAVQGRVVRRHLLSLPPASSSFSSPALTQGQKKPRGRGAGSNKIISSYSQQQAHK